jgi:hypothetical protein
MTIRRLAVLQWIGLLLGAAFAGAGFLAGYGVTEAECGQGSALWGIGNDTWEAVLLGVAALFVVAAEAAAVTVTLRTRTVSYESDAPPLSRIRFFAIASLVANALFLGVLALAALASIVDEACRQA